MLHSAGTRDIVLYPLYPENRVARLGAKTDTRRVKPCYISVVYIKSHIMNLTDIARPFSMVIMQTDTAIVASIPSGLVSIHISVLVVVILRLMAG